MRDFEKISTVRKDVGERNMKIVKLSEFNTFIKGISDFIHICQDIHKKNFKNNFTTIKKGI